MRESAVCDIARLHVFFPSYTHTYIHTYILTYILIYIQTSALIVSSAVDSAQNSN